MDYANFSVKGRHKIKEGLQLEYKLRKQHEVCKFTSLTFTLSLLSLCIEKKAAFQVTKERTKIHR